MDYKEFLNKQKGIYEKFENSPIRENGTNPSDIVTNGLRAYIIAFRHEESVNEKISKFSERIRKEIPVVRYASRDIHTTVSDYGQKIPKEFHLEESVLEKLSESVCSIGNLTSPTINYDKWIYNENTIIVAGVPCIKFYDLSERIIQNSKDKGIELRMPWGAHITATRFKEKLNPFELKNFFKLMKESPHIGESKPKFIDIGWYGLDKERFIFSIYKRFNLK